MFFIFYLTLQFFVDQLKNTNFKVIAKAMTVKVKEEISCREGEREKETAGEKIVRRKRRRERRNSEDGRTREREREGERDRGI